MWPLQTYIKCPHCSNGPYLQRTCYPTGGPPAGDPITGEGSAPVCVLFRSKRKKARATANGTRATGDDGDDDETLAGEAAGPFIDFSHPLPPRFRNENLKNAPLALDDAGVGSWATPPSSCTSIATSPMRLMSQECHKRNGTSFAITSRYHMSIVRRLDE